MRPPILESKGRKLFPHILVLNTPKVLKNGEMSRINPKEKRGGGQRDDSEVHISYSRGRLMQLIVDTERKLGVKHDHDFKYHFKKKINY